MSIGPRQPCFMCESLVEDANRRAADAETLLHLASMQIADLRAQLEAPALTTTSTSVPPPVPTGAVCATCGGEGAYFDPVWQCKAACCDCAGTGHILNPQQSTGSAPGPCSICDGPRDILGDGGPYCPECHYSGDPEPTKEGR